MIVTNRHKSFSVLTEEEKATTILNRIKAMSPAQVEALTLALAAPDYEQELACEIYDREKVSVQEWIENDYYLGRVGSSIYRAWKDDLAELFESGCYDQAIIVGSIGSGKSTFSHLAILRMLYEASCLADPATTYGLAPGSKIGFCNLATSKETARRVVFEGIVSKMKESPYFSHEFPPLKEVKDEIIFPKGLMLVAGSSTDTSIIGMNIFGGIIDEGNFLRSGAKAAQKQQASFARWGHFNKAGRLYEAVLRRMKSRYQKAGGKLPGILIVTSSKTTHDSFTERLIRQARAENSSSTFVRDRAVIDVKRDSFSKEVFRVLVGNEKYRSKILEKDEDEFMYGEDPLVVEVPEDLRKDFESNIEESLRDLAGVSTMAISSFINKVEKIDEMVDKSRKHPFVCPLNHEPIEWDSLSPFTIKWNEIATQTAKGEWLPRLHPEAKRHVHLDPALTGDAFGLCIGHVGGHVRSYLSEGPNPIEEQRPVFYVDFILRIKAQPGEEINFGNVRKILYEFSEHGFHLAKITMDSFQSRDMKQTLIEQGYNADLLSVDTSKEPYYTLRSAIYDGRVKSYPYPILLKELKTLEDTPLKIDHSEESSKDLADALCGVVSSLAEAGYLGQPLGIIKGESVPPGEGTTLNENLLPVSVQGQAVIVPSETPAVYKKAGPKTLAPSYKKVNVDGSVEDLSKRAIEPVIIRG